MTTDYPKSSCPNTVCESSYPVETGYKSSLSTLGCNRSSYFDCYNSVELNRQNGPTNTSPISYDLNSNENKVNYLNPQVYLNKLDPYFKAETTGYTTPDPRQFDVPRAMKITSDSVPINGRVPLKDIYTNDNSSYNYSSKPYEKINDGQIIYYVDNATQNPFFKPVYSQEGEEISGLFIDPMGGVKPEYNRKLCYQNLYEQNSGFRAIQDTQFFREDLITLQQRRHNQEKWTARWGNSDY